MKKTAVILGVFLTVFAIFGYWRQWEHFIWPFNTHIQRVSEFPQSNDLQEQSAVRKMINVSLKAEDAELVERIAKNEKAVAWISHSTHPQAKKSEDGMPLEHDVGYFDLVTGKHEILIQRVENNLNPNPPAIAVSKGKIALGTYAEKLILIDASTKKIDIYNIPDGYNINNNKIYFYKDSVIFTAIKEGTYRTDTLFKFDVNKKSFEKIYQVRGEASWPVCTGYRITDMSLSNDGLYWEEYLDWCSKRIYKLKI